MQPWCVRWFFPGLDRIIHSEGLCGNRLCHCHILKTGKDRFLSKNSVAEQARILGECPDRSQRQARSLDSSKNPFIFQRISWIQVKTNIVTIQVRWDESLLKKGNFQTNCSVRALDYLVTLPRNK